MEVPLPSSSEAPYLKRMRLRWRKLSKAIATSRSGTSFTGHRNNSEPVLSKAKGILFVAAKLRRGRNEDGSGVPTISRGCGF